MSWFICAISGKSPQNWDMCKEIGLYGISSYNAKIRHEVNVGDDLIFWLTKKGFLGSATVTGQPRAPKGPAEVPWAGGIYRFSIVLPFSLDFECKEPVFIPFEKGRQKETGISAFSLQRGFALITDKAGEIATKAMKDPKSYPKKIRRVKSSQDEGR